MFGLLDKIPDTIARRANGYYEPLMLPGQSRGLLYAACAYSHIAPLYVAHLRALREFPDRRSALRSQWPMLVLVVGYTMLRLWIIAQPITNG